MIKTKRLGKNCNFELSQINNAHFTIQNYRSQKYKKNNGYIVTVFQIKSHLCC